MEPRRLLIILTLACITGTLLVFRLRPAPERRWLPASGHLWSGVGLFTGTGRQKAYVGEILGGNDRYQNPVTRLTGHGVKVLDLDGAPTWQDREALTNSGRYFVRADDPALRVPWWETLAE